MFILVKFPAIWGFLQVEHFAIFWKISHLYLKHFRIVCIILSSAYIKSFIYFSLSVPVNAS